MIGCGEAPSASTKGRLGGGSSHTGSSHQPADPSATSERIWNRGVTTDQRQSVHPSHPPECTLHPERSPWGRGRGNSEPSNTGLTAPIALLNPWCTEAGMTRLEGAHLDRVRVVMAHEGLKLTLNAKWVSSRDSTALLLELALILG